MLKISKVYKSFGSFTAVNGLDFNIKKGQIFGLLGPNGAGKTTLIRMITGLTMPTSGIITLMGKYSPNNKKSAQELGYMPQQHAIYPGLSVLENILFFGRLYNIPEKKLKNDVEKILEMVELWEKKDTKTDTLSGGMIRRTMLATTLIHDPSLIILDEPTAGIDPYLRLKFWDWFEKLSIDGKSILITTHHIAEASNCHEVVFLRSGEILEQGTPSALMDKFNVSNLEEAFVSSVRDKNPQGGN
jgi:ABC-2 type transport system ATP-binding protein